MTEPMAFPMIDPHTRFLIVDDLSSMRQVVRNLLRKLGYENVDVAEDGFTALTKLKTGQFDFVISDWKMPGMTGLALLHEIRADPAMCKMPVLMITAEATKANIIAAAQAGANGYVVKPFSAATLEEKLAGIFDSLKP